MSVLDFSEFTAFEDKIWKQKIQMDLHGKDYNTELIWESPEGIAIQPFYTKNKTRVNPVPGIPETWAHTTHIFMGIQRVVHQLIKQKLALGIRSFILSAEAPFESEELFKLLAHQNTQVILRCNFLNRSWLNEVISQARLAGVTMHLNQDPLHFLANTGNWPSHSENVFRLLHGLLSQQSNDGTILGVNALIYAESGANNLQQLAYSMAQANETLEQINRCGPLPKSLELNYTVGLSPNYFMTIATLRALRRLNKLLGEIHNRDIKCHITVLPARRFMTLYDFNNNLLRHSTSLMAGILGGANAVCNLPYDDHFKKSHEFSQSLAENQLLILKSEVLTKTNAQMASGAYYIEYLTEKLAEQALDLFKKIEASGGWLEAIKKGTLQRKIKEQHLKSVNALSLKDTVVVGINKFANQHQNMEDQIELYPFQKMNPQKTLVAPIVARRLTENIESQRLNDEKKN